MKKSVAVIVCAVLMTTQFAHAKRMDGKSFGEVSSMVATPPKVLPTTILAGVSGVEKRRDRWMLIVDGERMQHAVVMKQQYHTERECEIAGELAVKIAKETYGIDNQFVCSEMQEQTSNV